MDSNISVVTVDSMEIVRARDKQTGEIVALKQIRMEGEKSGV
jgi:hypothetical protein